MNRFAAYQANSPCNLCGQNAGTLIATHDRHRRPLPVNCCSGCGLSYIDPLPSAEELSRFYAERYRLEYKGVYTPRLYHVYRAGKLALKRFRIASLLASPPARVLDCGSGGGEFAYLLAHHGYQPLGIEPDDGYREYSKREYNINVIKGVVDQLHLDHSSFDLITIFHVLEHLRDPQAVLHKLSSWLRADGYLHVEVPNVLSNISSPKNLYHPAHLFYFAAAPLAALACHAGLAPIFVEGSPSQANLTAVFQKRRTSQNALLGSAHDDVVTANRQRTIWRYLSSPATLGHILPRMLHRTIERQRAKSARSGCEILDQLYQAESPLVFPVEDKLILPRLAA